MFKFQFAAKLASIFVPVEHKVLDVLHLLCMFQISAIDAPSMLGAFSKVKENEAMRIAET